MVVKVSTFGESTTIVEAALTWYDAGCSVIPIRADGTKRPQFDWNSYQETRASRERVFNWFRLSRPAAGIGIVCGKISGSLEMLELEGRAATGDDIDKIMSECEKRGVAGTFTSLMHEGYAEWTPSGGIHFLYRIADHDVPGNTKVARRPATEEELAEKPGDKIKVLSETRGEGGYLVVAPSGGTVHPTGDSWSVAAGRLGAIPTISWDSRCKLHEAFHAALDEMPAAPQPAIRPKLASLLSSGRPGDEFNDRAQWSDILGPHGWTVSHVQGHTTYWVRPGKDKRDGHSATTGRAADGDRLYVFSSSTVFDQEMPYNKFSAYTLLEHGGDYAASARALRALGYGAPATGGVASAVPATVADPGWADTALDKAAASTAVAVRDPNWRHDWAKPFIAADAFQYQEQSLTEAGKIYAKVYEDTFKYCGELKKWFFFNGCTWGEDRLERFEQGVIHLLTEGGAAARRDENTDLAKWIRTMGRSSSPNVARWARSDPRLAVAREHFDQRRHLITLVNGVFDLDTATFTDGHDPKLLLTKSIGIKYDKDAKAARWAKFLEQVLPSGDMRGYVQRAAGLTLLGDAQERALFLLHGKSGTGKSQFIRVMELLFGDFAETASATTFNASSKTATLTNDLNDLRGKRFVSLSELDQDERLNESLVKRLTGGDTAKSRGLYQENRQWRVEFMMWMATNYLPRLNSDDNAIWKRVKPIEFPVEVATLGPEDKGLAEKIFAEEASGILNWLLEGVRLYQEHGLDDLDEISSAVATYRRDVDSVAQFIDAAVEEHTVVRAPEQVIPSRNLNAMYQAWCTSNGIRWLGERRFAQRMESLGFERKRTNTGAVWLGIGTGNYGMLGTVMRQ